MIKRVFIVHRWEGSPEVDWYPWLKQQLTEKGFEVVVPAMPNPAAPDMVNWVSFLRRQVGQPDEQTFFTGHSIGCQTILRYLETLPDIARVGGVVLVAPWLHLTPEAMPDEESRKIAEPWLQTPINWRKVAQHTENFAAIFSDNDPYVPLGDVELFRQNLLAKIIVEERKGHFTAEEGIKELTSVLNELLEMMQ